ncbi:MAG: ComEC/Rec2 family competence protein [Candidatus Levybacteria bacterium]|nr:ComEC/Rec2 family competence protein [Candidatus Levybacteria bacterium]
MIKKTVVVVSLLLISLLCWRFHAFYQEKPEYSDGQGIRLEVVLQEEAELSNRGQQFAVTDAYNQTIYVTAEAFPRLHYGQSLSLSGDLQKKELDDGRVLFSLYYPKVTHQVNAETVAIGLASAIRSQSQRLYENTLPPTSASLLMGIVFGAKEHFPDDFFDALQATGVLHVIAASGMNVTFIAAALLFGLGAFLRRQLALILGCFGIIFYVFLVGFEPSIIRASIMAILAFGASLFGRQHFAALAVLMSAYMMLLFQPGFLIDLGFQLSFLATLSIIFIKPLIPLPQNFFTESLSTTLAAQLGTMPLLLSVFGQFGLLSLLVNALVLWVVPIVMLVGSLSAVLNLIFPPLAQVIVILALPFLVFFEVVVRYFGTSNWVLDGSAVPWHFGIGYYLFIVAWITLKKPSHKPVSLRESLALEKF